MVSNRESSSTRRRFIRRGATATVAGMFAGCSGSDGTGGETVRETETPESGGETPTEKQRGAATPTPDEYAATLAPAGEVTFDAVPEEVFTILTHHADMALALGYGDAINALHAPDYYDSLWSKFTHRLDGVTVDWTGLYSSWPPTKEKLFELDSDIHLADPAKVATADGWDDGDVEEVRRSVGPWFGNTFSATHEEPPASWADRYEYYTLWEIFERVADAFRERDRYEALAEVRRSLLSTIEEGLPPEEERPNVAMVLFSTSDDRMWGYELNQPGYYAAHTRPLGATDAIATNLDGYGSDESNIELDHEALLEADPDVLLVLGPMTDLHNIEDIRASLESHPVASDITAVQEGRIHVQGARTQGPLLNLFQLELTAKQLYPDQFGEWPGYADGDPYPEIPAAERLFDRDRVASIVTDGA